MKKKSYKWLARLVDKITKNDCQNNNYFTYYGREIILQSGTRDYVDVLIQDYDGQINFTFDFWTEEIVFETYNDWDERDAIINAFKKFYDNASVEYDAPWEKERDFYLPMIDNDEYDQESVIRQYNDWLSHKAE